MGGKSVERCGKPGRTGTCFEQGKVGFESKMPRLFKLKIVFFLKGIMTDCSVGPLQVGQEVADLIFRQDTRKIF